MKFNKLIIGLLSIQILFLSCQKNEIIPIKKNYTYDLLTSNLNVGVLCTRFIDEKIGFVGNNEGIFKTTDKGIHFKNVCNTELPIKSIYFVNSNVGFAVGGHLMQPTDNIIHGSIVYKTTNAGDSWVKQTVPLKDSELNSVFFIDEKIGFAIGYKLHVKTIDGGVTWTEFEFEYQGLMNKIGFIDSQNGYAIGTNGAYFKTANQGKTWTISNLGTQGHLNDFSFVDQKTGYIAGEQEVLKTTDGGNTWASLANSPSKMTYIHFINDKSGIAFGKVLNVDNILIDALFFTLDGGITWDKELINFVPIIDFPLNTVGYSVMTNTIVRIDLK